MDCPNKDMEELRRRVIKDKAQFVMRLSAAYVRAMGSEVTGIRYYHVDDRELIRITYICGHVEYINVTMNSTASIAKEIALQIAGDRAFGHIRDSAKAEEWLQRKLVEKWSQ